MSAEIKCDEKSLGFATLRGYDTSELSVIIPE